MESSSAFACRIDSPTRLGFMVVFFGDTELMVSNIRLPSLTLLPAFGVWENTSPRPIVSYIDGVGRVDPVLPHCSAVAWALRTVSAWSCPEPRFPDRDVCQILSRRLQAMTSAATAAIAPNKFLTIQLLKKLFVSIVLS